MDKEILEFLNRFIAFKTVSSNSRTIKDFRLAQKFLFDFLTKLGFQTKIIGKPHSLIVAYKLISSQRPTIGIYSHYDVQPEGNLSEWHSKPFLIEEMKLNFISAGHYRTETFGVQALGKKLEKKFQVKTKFIPAKTIY